MADPQWDATGRGLPLPARFRAWPRNGSVPLEGHCRGAGAFTVRMPSVD